MMIKYTGDRLSTADIIDICDGYDKIAPAQEELYYLGDNVGIKSRSSVGDIPNWSIPVSYGRKLIKTVSGYMFKPGLITYEIDDAVTADTLDVIYKDNREQLLNNNLGTYLGVNGVVYELHYLTAGSAGYRMTMVTKEHGIPIYNYDIDPVMMAFIRLYERGAITMYEVYYPEEIITYARDRKTNRLSETTRLPNFFKQIPVVVYENNSEKIGDITVVRPLIDAYDVLTSDSMNEFDRFAWSYLKIVGSLLSKEDADKIKKTKIFQGLENENAVSYLTKEIPTGFISHMADHIRGEIHRQSFIPNIDEISFSGTASGVAITKYIYMIEYVAADKEANFRDSLIDRLRLINQLKPIDINSVKINFARNTPSSNIENARVYGQYDGRGISRETLMRNFATFVDDPVAELKLFNEEQTVDIGVIDGQIDHDGRPADQISGQAEDGV